MLHAPRFEASHRLWAFCAVLAVLLPFFPRRGSHRGSRASRLQRQRQMPDVRCDRPDSIDGWPLGRTGLGHGRLRLRGHRGPRRRRRRCRNDALPSIARNRGWVQILYCASDSQIQRHVKIGRGSVRRVTRRARRLLRCQRVCRDDQLDARRCTSPLCGLRRRPTSVRFQKFA